MVSHVEDFRVVDVVSLDGFVRFFKENFKGFSCRELVKDCQMFNAFMEEDVVLILVMCSRADGLAGLMVVVV